MLTRHQCLKILLVEDDLADATLIEDLLGSFSESLFCLQTVKCLERGLACLEAEKFDAILLDLSVSDCLGGREDIASLKLPHARSPIGSFLTLSCGMATAIPSPQESPDTLIRSADSALFQAKTEGKNRIFHASSKSESASILM